MDILTFLSNIVSSTIWPVTLLLIFLFLRRPLLNLFSVMNKLKVQDVEIEFGNKVYELKENSLSLLSYTGIRDSNQKRTARLYELASISPRSAILESWLELEEVSISKLKGRKVKGSSSMSPLKLGDSLLEHDILDQNTYFLYNQLRNLRNAAVHAVTISIKPETAAEYVEMTGALIDSVEKS